MSDAIPFLDLPAQHRAIKSELMAMLEHAVDNAAFIGGQALADFESGFANYCGTDGCVGVGNGTDALMLALRALGVGPGDEVVVPAYTFIATAEAVTMVGATPRLVDVQQGTFNMDPEQLAVACSDRTKAIIPVHLYGQPADVDAVCAFAKERGLSVVEDCAQSHGATLHDQTVGSFGDFGAFSFYPGKNLGAMGDGGAVVGPASDALERVRRLSNHGRLSRYEHAEPGVNSRLDAIQAGALSIKLRHIADWSAARARVAGWYDERLAGVDGVSLPTVAPNRTHVYHLYVLQTEAAEALGSFLSERGVGCGHHYPLPLHRQPAYRSLGYAEGDFPVAERVAAQCLSVPVFPELTEGQVDRVAHLVREFFAGGAS